MSPISPKEALGPLWRDPKRSVSGAAAPRSDELVVARRDVFLHAGEIYSSAAHSSVTTIVGSCVAVCACDADSGIGGVNHFLLPHHAASVERSLRFGNVATEELIAAIVRLGASRNRIRARVFGGASVVAELKGEYGKLGLRNAAVAIETLERLNVPVVEHDTGGRRGRKIHYDTRTGEALVRLV